MGQRRIVDHCLDMAQHLVMRIDETPELELLSEVQLNIVPFRYKPGGKSDKELDALNERLGRTILDDARFLVGPSRLGQRTFFGPAFSNWGTRCADVDEFVEAVLELGREQSN